MALLHVMNKLFLIVAGLLSFAVFALQQDAQQPIEIKAHTVLIDERTGVSIYTGNVKVSQGSLRLSAETVHVFSVKNQVNKMIAKGDKNKRAHYQQNQVNQQRFIEANALNITYLVGQESLHLKGKAHLIQGFDSFRGDTLDYDVKNNKIVAKQSKDGTQRVKFKIKL